MKAHLAALIIPFSLAGCMALSQTHIHPPRPDFICHVTSGRLYVGWKSDSVEPSRQSDLDLDSSWAISPSGHVYAFSAVPRTYFTGEKSLWKDTSLSLREPTMAQGMSSGKWTNGSWKLFIAFTKRIPRKPIETEVAISTFYYNPIIHGPPN